MAFSDKYGFRFNARNSEDFFIVERAPIPVYAPISDRAIEIPGRPGAYDAGRQVQPRFFKIDVAIHTSSREELMQKIREISAWLDTDTVKPLVFHAEPDKQYLARVTGEFEVEKKVGVARGSFTFFVPDPYAWGDTHIVKIDSPSEPVNVTFNRNSAAYLNDGTQFNANKPRFQSGKLAQAIFIEEGTTNLLSSASSPTQEEVSVSVGQDYYLTTVGGSATVEHKKHESLNLKLDKEGEGGQDFQHTDTTRNDFMAGTHQNTIVPNGSITLDRSGTDYDFTWDTKEEWEDPSNTRNNTGSADEYDDLDLINLPEWEFIDDMRDYTAEWRVQNPGYGEVIQNDDYVTIRGTSVESNFGIDTQNNPDVTVRFPCTIYLLYRGRDSSNARFIIEDGTTYGYTYSFDDEENKWNHYWIRATTTQAIVYKNGVQIATVPVRSGGGATNQIQIDIQSGGSGDFDIGAIYIDWGYDKGPPPADGWWTGTWETPYIDLSQVGVVQEASIGWGYWYWVSNLEDYEDGDIDFADIAIEYQIRKNGVEQGWVTIFNNPSAEGEDDVLIPDLPSGTNMSGVEIKLRITLKTRDPSGWPYFEYLRLYVKSGYHTIGTYTSQVFDVSTVGTAVDSLLTGSYTVPTGTSVSVEVSVDGGAFTAASFDSPIPGIAQTTPSTLQYRIILETTDVSVRPSLEEITIQIIAQGTTYVPEKTFSLTPVDVSSVGTAAGSIIEWQADTPSSTSITIETSLDGSTWTPVTNGGSFIPAGTDLTGKSVYIRGTLSTTDNTVTPFLSYIDWRIEQEETNRIKPATETLFLTPSGVTRWQLEPKTYPTTWNNTGTRAPEILTVPGFADLMHNFQGTLMIWAYDDLKSIGRDRYILDTEGHKFLIDKVGSNGHYQIFLNGSYFADTEPISSPGWVHFAVRWFNQTVAFFVNGTKVKEASIGEALDWKTDADKLWIGSDYNGAQHWNSLIDELHIRNLPLSDSEIRDIATTGKGTVPDENTTLYMDFDNTVDPEGYDQPKELIYNGTATGFPIITAKFRLPASGFRITDALTGDYVEVVDTFNPGDALRIDCERHLVEAKEEDDLGFTDIMPALTLGSRFLRLRPGLNRFLIKPEGNADVWVEFTERWK